MSEPNKLSSLIAKFNNGKGARVRARPRAGKLTHATVPDSVVEKEKHGPSLKLATAKAPVAAPPAAASAQQPAPQLTAQPAAPPAEPVAPPAPEPEPEPVAPSTLEREREPMPAAPEAAPLAVEAADIKPITLGTRKTRVASRKTRVAPKLGSKFDFVAMSSRFDSLPLNNGDDDEDEFSSEPSVAAPPKLGVKVSHVVKLFAPDSVAHMTNEEVFFQFIQTEAGDGAYVDTIDASLGVTGPASTFVTYSVADLWSDLVQALEASEDHDRFVWIDMLCYAFGKHRMSARRSIAANKVAPGPAATPARNDFLSIAAAVYGLGGIEVLLTQPEAPPVLRSLPGVHELYVAARLNKPLLLLMVPQEKDFLKSLVLSGEASRAFFERVAETINTTKPRDPSQAVIVDYLADIPDVTKHVTRVVKACYVQVIEDVIATTPMAEQPMEAQRAHKALCYCHQVLGTANDAVAALEKAVAASKEAFGPTHRNTGNDLVELGSLLHAVGRYEEAVTRFEEAMPIKVKAHGEEHKEISRLQNKIAVALKCMGKTAEAKERYMMALEMDKHLYGGDHPEVAADLANLGQLALDVSDFELARSFFDQAYAMDKSALGAKHPDVAIDLTNIGTLLSVQGKLADAEPFLSQALQIRREQLGDNDVLTAQSMNILAYLLKQLGKDDDKASMLGKKALEVYDDKLGADHPFTKQLAILWDS